MATIPKRSFTERGKVCVDAIIQRVQKKIVRGLFFVARTVPVGTYKSVMRSLLYTRHTPIEILL